MSKPRLFIPVTSKFAVRYIFRTGLLAQLSAFATPLVLLGWNDVDLRRQAEALGCEVYILPATLLSAEYNRIRKKIDVWYQYRLLRSPSAVLKERQREQLALGRNRWLRKLRRWYMLTEVSLPGVVKRLLRVEHELMQREVAFTEAQVLLERLKPDAGFCLTPYHWEEDALLRAAQSKSIPLCISILSFDNLTTRGWLSLKYDHYLVWNHYNCAELLRGYPSLTSENITLVGPVQFDFYWDERFFWPEAEWRKQMGIPRGRPVLLYAGNSAVHVPHEPILVQQIDEAIKRKELPAMVILLRLHPMDSCQRWLSLLTSSQNIILDEAFRTDAQRTVNSDFRKLKQGIISDDDMIRLASTLRYSQVHVNVCSTMSLDGAIFDRPQINPAYDDTSERKYDHMMREHYQKEHYTPLVYSGGVDVVYSRDEMINSIHHAITNPGKQAAQRRKMLEDVCTYVDGQSTQRVSAALQNFLNSKPGYKE